MTNRNEGIKLALHAAWHQHHAAHLAPPAKIILGRFAAKQLIQETPPFDGSVELMQKPYHFCSTPIDIDIDSAHGNECRADMVGVDGTTLNVMSKP